MKFQKTSSGGFTESVNPLNNFDPKTDLQYSLNEISQLFRDNEAPEVQTNAKYKLSGSSLIQEFPGGCQSHGVFNNKDATTLAATLNLVKTILVMFVLTGAVMAFTNDAAHLVIEPIERMMSTVTKLAENPLATTTKKKDNSKLEAEKEGFETMLLERTIKK